MRTIKWKLVAMYLGLVFLVMIVSGSFILLRYQNNEMEKARDQLEVYAQMVSEQVVLNYDESSFQSGLIQIARSGSTTGQIQGSILDRTGATLATTVTSRPPYPQYKNSVVIGAMAGTATFSRRQITDDSGTPFLAYGYPVTINEETAYVVYAQMDASSIFDSIAQTRSTIFVSVGIALLITAVMGYVFAKNLTNPIVALTGRAKELARGKLNQSVRVYSHDEIGQLSESFNYMARELSRTVSDITKEKSKLEVILHNMTDGVLSFDLDGQVLQCNSASLAMLGIEKADFTFKEFLEKFGLGIGLYVKLLEHPQTRKEDFWVGEKYLTAAFSPYAGEGGLDGVVVVLQDNTEQKKLDDMRKEFVANVSHELRTPLTTVKSYAETLLDGAMEDPEIARDFLGIINNEADRMSFLVRDLLQLSRFDNKQIVLQKREVSLNEFLEETVRQNKIHASNKQQTLLFRSYPGDVVIQADPDRLGQVVNNVLTNAFKYSGEGASITVWLEEEDGYGKIFVKDTGMGIAKEDLDRIFERFYRVDKARSRAMGGTGLGLAIVKEIMEAHQGKITVESQLGVGTTMVLWFPIDGKKKV